MTSDLKVVVKAETFDIGAGNLIVRYKVFRTFKSLKISVTVKDKKEKRRHVAGSPGSLNGWLRNWQRPIHIPGHITKSIKALFNYFNDSISIKILSR